MVTNLMFFPVTTTGARPTHPETPKPTGVNSSPLPTKSTSPRPTPSGCTSTFKAVFLDKTSEQTYVINNDKVYVLGRSSALAIERGPIQVSKIFPAVNTVDSAYTKEDGSIVLFSGNRYVVLPFY